MNPDWLSPLLAPFRLVAGRGIARLPSFAAAFLLLLTGLFAARAVRALIERLLQRARLDEALQGVGVAEVLSRLGMGKSPAYVLGFLAYWFILFAFFVSAADAVELAAVSELLERFALFLPSVTAALLVLFGGLMFARFLSQVVANAASANEVRGGEALSKAAYAAVVVFASMMALEQLGLRMLLLSSSIQILLASVGLAFALAFGLGGKAIAEELLRGLIQKKKDQ
ncbi:MAG: hypothetical protein AAB339_09120 [Elusimicrobiota bacterium]